MGRPRDPTRERRGTGHRPKPSDGPTLTIVPTLPDQAQPPPAPDPITVLLNPPEDLPEEAHEIWEQAIAELVSRQLKPADLESIRQMCVAAARARQAASDISRYGLVVEGERGPMTNPLLKVERDATLTYQKIAAEYGLTLASRMRLGVVQLTGQSMLQALQQDLDVAVEQAAPRRARPAKRTPAKRATTKRTPKK